MWICATAVAAQIATSYVVSIDNGYIFSDLQEYVPEQVMTSCCGGLVVTSWASGAVAGGGAQHLANDH